jgi:NAD-dependent DNA ligase
MVHIKTDDITDDVEIKNIYYFFSTLNTMGLGEKIVEKLYNAGYDTILKIIQLKQTDISIIEGFKEKSAENIVTNIRKSLTNIPLAILMKASNKLGRGMGEERAKDVLLHMPNIMTEYKQMTEDMFVNKLKQINGWEEKTSRMFAKNFKHFIDFYNSIKNYVTIETTSKKTGDKFKDMKIVMSGFRDKDLEKYIEDNGGIIQSGVSKNTTILIIKDESVRDTSKALKAKELGVEVMTKDEFID